MPNRPDDTHTHDPAKHPLVMRVTDNDFQCEVLEKLARLEAKMDMLVGGSQPGRMTVAEEKIEKLERSDIRRSVYDRLVNVIITTALSALIAFHDKWWNQEQSDDRMIGSSGDLYYSHGSSPVASTLRALTAQADAWRSGSAG